MSLPSLQYQKKIYRKREREKKKLYSYTKNKQLKQMLRNKSDNKSGAQFYAEKKTTKLLNEKRPRLNSKYTDMLNLMNENFETLTCVPK